MRFYTICVPLCVYACTPLAPQLEAHAAYAYRSFLTNAHELTFILDFHDILPIWFHLVAMAETAFTCQHEGTTDLFIRAFMDHYTRVYVQGAFPVRASNCITIHMMSQLGWMETAAFININSSIVIINIISIIIAFLSAVVMGDLKAYLTPLKQAKSIKMGCQLHQPGAILLFMDQECCWKQILDQRTVNANYKSK